LVAAAWFWPGWSAASTRLDCIRDPQLQRDVHRPQNRIEAYHKLRSAISQVGGKKQLIANVIVAYNSILLSALLGRYRAAADQKAIMLLRKISPVTWQQIHFLGRYLFRGNRHPIGVEALLARVVL
jgi:hypothetical protein